MKKVDFKLNNNDNIDGFMFNDKDNNKDKDNTLKDKSNSNSKSINNLNNDANVNANFNNSNSLKGLTKNEPKYKLKNNKCYDLESDLNQVEKKNKYYKG